MASNYNIMANYIVSKYIERVSGKDLGETFVDDDPSKRVMVGMLSEDRVEAKFEGGYVENTNTRFDSIPSISISFIVKKNESGILHVIPAGLLFYMVQPSYKTQWILRLSAIKNKLSKESYSVPVDEYSYVKSVYDWIMEMLTL